METFCAWCGKENPAQPCSECGHTGTTPVPPSNEPCAYCGARPTWPIVWGEGSNAHTIYLCAQCDADEMSAFDND